MFTEEESFVLSSLNAAQGTCSYDDNNEQHRLLVVNETGILALRAGLGPDGNRYGLERLTVQSLVDGAKLVGCNVVRSSRCGGGGGGGDGSESLGMVVALAIVAPLPPSALQGGTKQGDAAGGPNVRSAAATPHNPAAAAAAGTATGVLNVYALGGERSFEVERALQRRPQQQLSLPYAPEGMAHTKVWRNVAAPPNFVGEEGGGGGTTPTPSSPANSNRRFWVEEGDAVLVWDQNGVVHGYTRWEGGGGVPAADSSTSRNGGGGGGSGGRGPAGNNAMLSAEPWESLKTLVPELKDVDGPVSCLSFDAEEDGDAGARRRRWLLMGCNDGARCSSLDVASGRRETAASPVAGPVCAVALNTRPRFMPHHLRSDGLWGGDVAGFACTELDTLAWLLKGGGDGDGDDDGRRHRPHWCTGTLPLVGAGGDQLTCIECADFCRDGSTSVVVGTNLGKVVVYGAEADPDGDATTTAVGGAENNKNGGDEGLAFGLGNVDFDDGVEDGDSGSSDAAARRGEYTSPRPPGGAAAAAATAEKQHDSRRSMERAGSCDAVADCPSKSSSSNSPPLLSARWQRDVPHGVLNIACGDFNHDGVSELVVVTRYGVHVFHPDYREEANRFAKTMYALKMLQPKDEQEEEEEEEEEEVVVKAADESTSSTSEEDNKSSPDVVDSFGTGARNGSVSVGDGGADA